MEEEKLQKMFNEQTKELKSDYLRQGKFLLEQFEKKTSFIAEQYGDLKKKANATFDKVGEISERLDKNETIQKILISKIDNISQKLDATFEMTGRLTEDMSFVKDELRIIKNELKEKAGKGKFSILEKRVLILEKKMV